jgi:hypothetical protein
MNTQLVQMNCTSLNTASVQVYTTSVQVHTTSVQVHTTSVQVYTTSVQVYTTYTHLRCTHYAWIHLDFTGFSDRNTVICISKKIFHSKGRGKTEALFLMGALET